MRILRDAETKTIGAAARQQLDTWRQEYNVSRPHRALQDWAPAKFASNHVEKDRIEKVKPARELALNLA